MSDRRRVHRLRLAAESSEDVGLGQRRLEQALSRVNLPTDGLPGLVLVRRLEGIDVDLGLDFTDLVRVLERSLTEQLRSALSIGQAGAERANAVRVWHVEEACIELIVALCRSGAATLSSWYWPKLFPEVRADSSAQRAIEAALARLSRADSPALQFGALVSRLLRDRQLRAFTRTLTQTSGHLLRQRFVAASPSPAAFARTQQGAESEQRLGVERETLERAALELASDATLCEFVDVAREVVPVWGMGDPRSEWVGFELASRALPRSPTAQLRLRALALAWLRHLVLGGANTAQGRSPEPPSPGQPTAEARERAHRPRRPPQHEGETGVGASLSRSDEAEAPAASLAFDRSDDVLGERPIHSDYCGLLFLTNVLTRLGFDDAVARSTDALLGPRLLWYVADRLGVPAEDGMRQVLTQLLAELDAVAACDHDPHCFHSWLDRVDCALQDAGLELHGVCRRSGYARISRTHLDVFLPLRCANAAIRRAALDLDPGHVSWLARVVLFHYVSDAQLLWMN